MFGLISINALNVTVEFTINIHKVLNIRMHELSIGFRRCFNERNPDIIIVPTLQTWPESFEMIPILEILQEADHRKMLNAHRINSKNL